MGKQNRRLYRFWLRESPQITINTHLYCSTLNDYDLAHDLLTSTKRHPSLFQTCLDIVNKINCNRSASSAAVSHGAEPVLFKTHSEHELTLINILQFFSAHRVKHFHRLVSNPFTAHKTCRYKKLTEACVISFIFLYSHGEGHTL